MFGRAFHLFSIFGIPIRVDLSWFLIAALGAWSLATGLFPSLYEPGRFSAGVYWVLGLLGMLGLFASVLAHELGHARVAQKRGLPMGGITLFLFGGVAEMRGESNTPKTELLIAIAGPIVSVVLGIVLVATLLIPLPAPAPALLMFVGGMNLVLAAFNMIPAFPMDGGRVLRAVLWAWRGDYLWATRISARMGQGFGGLLIVAGTIQLLGLDERLGAWFDYVPGDSVWSILIGLFVWSLAKNSYEAAKLRGRASSRPASPAEPPAPANPNEPATREDGKPS